MPTARRVRQIEYNMEPHLAIRSRGVDLTFATHMDANSESECQIQLEKLSELSRGCPRSAASSVNPNPSLP
jgi:hypothetical protein